MSWDIPRAKLLTTTVGAYRSDGTALILSEKAVVFSANGEHVVSSDGTGVQVGRVEDGKEIATMKAVDVLCLAVSTDGKWIAAGTRHDVIVWDATTYEQVFEHTEGDWVNAIDFSPDSTQLVSTSAEYTATVWDILTGKQIQTLSHEEVGWVRAANLKYSPGGERIATAAPCSVLVWDSRDGRLLVNVPVAVTPKFNTGLLWSPNHHLFVLSKDKIKQFDASTGSPVSEWSVPKDDYYACIALPRDGEFIAYSTNYEVTFWDVSTHTQQGLVQHAQHIRTIAFSPGSQFLAIGSLGGETSIESLSCVFVCTMSCCILYLIDLFAPLVFDMSFLPASQEPRIKIGDTVLKLWKHDQLEDAEASLTAVIVASQNLSEHVLASRALIRARLRKWDAALLDAGKVCVRVTLRIYPDADINSTKAIRSQPSVMAYVAKGIAHVGKGERHEGYGTCDIALEYFDSSHVTFVLLIKVCTFDFDAFRLLISL